VNPFSRVWLSSPQPRIGGVKLLNANQIYFHQVCPICCVEIAILNIEGQFSRSQVSKAK